MALKNFSKLSTRRQGEVVGELHRLICSHPFFPVRTRVSLREHLKTGDFVYWLEDSKSGSVQAMTLIDTPFIIEDIVLHNLGFMIGKNIKQLREVFDQAYSDYSQKGNGIIIITRQIIADAISLEEKGFICFETDTIYQKLPKLANYKTNYYGVFDTLAEGMKKKQDICYVKLESDIIDRLA